MFINKQVILVFQTLILPEKNKNIISVNILYPFPISSVTTVFPLSLSGTLRRISKFEEKRGRH